MTGAFRRWLAVAVVFLPMSADAQTMTRSFEELQGILNADETVIVTDMAGRKVKGTITALDPDSLALSTGGRTQMFTQSDVRTVRATDGLSNGTLIGAGVGLGAALGILGIAASGDSYVLPSAKVAVPLLFSGAGALVGGLVDRAHEGGRVLYASPGRSARLAVSPVLGRDRQGVLLSVRF